MRNNKYTVLKDFENLVNSSKYRLYILLNLT
nr:MAG TPA: hypothetical protein [Bacteriophage sp.]